VSFVSLPAYFTSLRSFLVIPSTKFEGAAMAMAVVRNSTMSSSCTSRWPSESVGTSPIAVMVVIGKGEGRESRSSCERALSE
jgi:hypothetical protein